MGLNLTELVKGSKVLPKISEVRVCFAETFLFKKKTRHSI